MRRILHSAGFCLLLAAISAALGLPGGSLAHSQEPGDGALVAIGTFRLFHSDILDEDRLLLVCLPRDYEIASISYPVVFVLYGDHIRGYFAEAVHVVDQLSEQGSMPEAIVVGVANVDRYRDLSPVGRQGRPSGIEPFYRFFVEELIPFVQREYRTKDYRVLVGPQAGAEFGLYALAKWPGVFDAFIIENPFRFPSVYDVLMPMMEELVGKPLPFFTFLQITSADRAGNLEKTQEMEYARRFEEMYTDKLPHNLTLVAHYVENSEDFLPPLLLKEGLKGLFREYRFPESLEMPELRDIRGYYAGLSERFGFEIDVPERTLASAADKVSQKGGSDSALTILEYLVQAYPASLDGHWRLANLYRELGDVEAAIKHYRRCLEIMPNMPPARDWIERLEGAASGDSENAH